METNTYCEHTRKELFGPFCVNCGCIFKHSDESGCRIFSLKPKSLISSLDIPPLETFAHIEKVIGYKIYFKKVREHMSEFYKKARVSCMKFIKRLVEDYKFSARSFYTAVFYLDLIYLNYDYYSILKDFKSELIAIGCFLVAGKL